MRTGAVSRYEASSKFANLSPYSETHLRARRASGYLDQQGTILPACGKTKDKRSKKKEKDRALENLAVFDRLAQRVTKQKP